jgi:solute carrier family 13 (sodium-dependent dicarboxylate transporter), member 2/3/5
VATTDGIDVRDQEPELGQGPEPVRVGRRAQIGRFGGPVVALLVYAVLPSGDGGLSPGGRATVAVGLLMAVWWVTEALPLPATSLLPLALFPVTGVLSIEDAAAPYADDLIFLFMGGFMIALAMQRWGLHRRIALVTVRTAGMRPAPMVGGFMAATAFISMWVSNTATTVMMLPIGLSILTLVFGSRSPDRTGEDRTGEGRTGEDRTGGDGAGGDGAGGDADGTELTGAGAPNLATGLMLGIAYAASIGSLATLIGTPPNVFMAGFLADNYDIDIGFGQWMLVGLPLSLVFLVITWYLLTKVLFRSELTEIEGGRELIDSELAEMGPPNRGEQVVGVVFVVTALAWMFRSFYTPRLAAVFPSAEGIDDAGIAIAAALALFIIPVNFSRGVFALDWETARQLPWGVLLLFGGGLSLAAAVSENEVDVWIGEQVEALGALPAVLLIAATVVIVIFLTELTSNTATAAAILPILAGVATGLGFSPLALVVPAALAASCAFMLPVATPPNAIVFGSGHVTIGQMVRGGVFLNLIGIVLITAAVYLLAVPILGVSFS